MHTLSARAYVAATCIVACLTACSGSNSIPAGLGQPVGQTPQAHAVHGDDQRQNLTIEAYPTAPPSVLAHSYTMEAANAGVAQYNSSFGYTNWAYVKPYVDLVMAGSGQTYQNVRAGGLPSASYFDISACSGASLPDPNPYPSPDCSTWPATAFYAQPGSPANVLNSGSTMLQLAGDPGSSDLQSLLIPALDSIQNTTPEAMAEFDGAAPPDEANAGGKVFCWGYNPANGNGGNCQNSPGGSAAAPWGSTFSRQEWIAGYESIIAQSPMPVMMNGIGPGLKNGTPPAASIVAAASPNAWGVACDWCFYHENKWLYTSPLLDIQLDAMIDVIAAGKNVNLVAESSDDIPSRMRALAIEMLMYDPKHSWIWGSACGGTSYIGACPESAWTFYGPLKGYPKSTASLQDPAGHGGYVREFAYCYAWGKPVGACATVVNPDTYNGHPLPRTRLTYRHTAQIYGDSLCNCFGATGSVAENGAPAPSIMPAASQFILFQ